MHKCLPFILYLLIIPLGFCTETEEETSRKFLIILQAGKESKDGMARAVHALLYSKELKEKNYEVTLVFDGAGTTWASEWMDPASDSKYTPLYQKLKAKGLAEVVCDYCSGAFQVKETLSALNAPLTDEYEGHPSIAKWITEGYEVMTL